MSDVNTLPSTVSDRDRLQQAERQLKAQMPALRERAATVLAEREAHLTLTVVDLKAQLHASQMARATGERQLKAQIEDADKTLETTRLAASGCRDQLCRDHGATVTELQSQLAAAQAKLVSRDMIVLRMDAHLAAFDAVAAGDTRHNTMRRRIEELRNESVAMRMSSVAVRDFITEQTAADDAAAADLEARFDDMARLQAESKKREWMEGMILREAQAQHEAAEQELDEEHRRCDAQFGRMGVKSPHNEAVLTAGGMETKKQ
jgi:hypothetical protein